MEEKNIIDGDNGDNKNKKSSKLLVVLCIFIFIVTFVLGWKFGGVIFEMFDSKDEEVVDKSEQKEKVVEVESNDEIFNDKIKGKINMIEKISSLNPLPLWPNIETGYREGDIYIKDVANSDIAAELKLYNILENLLFEYNRKSPVTTNYDFGDLNAYKEVITQLDVQLVEEEYIKLYGTKDFSHKDFSGCPMFIYDSVNKKYYGSAECGGASTVFLNTYVNRITTKGDEAYAYVSLGAINLEENCVYTNYERTFKYNGQVADYYGDIINKDNYKEFSEYKYTFTKDKDNYYFTSVERLS